MGLNHLIPRGIAAAAGEEYLRPARRQPAAVVEAAEADHAAEETALLLGPAHGDAAAAEKPPAQMDEAGKRRASKAFSSERSFA